VAARRIGASSENIGMALAALAARINIEAACIASGIAAKSTAAPSSGSA